MSGRWRGVAAAGRDDWPGLAWRRAVESTETEVWAPDARARPSEFPVRLRSAFVALEFRVRVRLRAPNESSRNRPRYEEFTDQISSDYEKFMALKSLESEE